MGKYEIIFTFTANFEEDKETITLEVLEPGGYMEDQADGKENRITVIRESEEGTETEVLYFSNFPSASNYYKFKVKELFDITG